MTVKFYSQKISQKSTKVQMTNQAQEEQGSSGKQRLQIKLFLLTQNFYLS